MSERGVTPVVAIALLIGATAIMALGLVLTASTLIGGITDQNQQEQTVDEFENLAQNIDDATQGQTTSGDLTVGGQGGGSAAVNQSAGSMNVTVVARNGTTLHQSLHDLGVLRYDTSSGVEVAYQGGGVWRVEDGHVGIERPPRLDHNRDPENGGLNSLTLPITSFSGDLHGAGQVDATVSVDSAEESVDLVERGLNASYITVAIESDLAAGWEQHARQNTPARIDESHDAGEPRRVVLNFSVVPVQWIEQTNDPDDRDPDPEDFPNPGTYNIDGAVTGNALEMGAGPDSVINGNVSIGDGADDIQRDAGSETINGQVHPYNETLPDVSDEYDNITSKYDVEWRGTLHQNEINDDEVIENGGIYGYERIDLQQNDLNITANDDVIIVVNESFDITANGDFVVTGDGNVSIIVEGDIEINSDGSIFGSPSEPSQVQVKTTGNLKATGNIQYYSVLWAPHGEVRINGNSEVEGAILSGNTSLQSGTINYSEVEPRTYTNEGGSGPGPSDGTPDSGETAYSADIGDTGVAYVTFQQTRVEIAS